MTCAKVLFVLLFSGIHLLWSQDLLYSNRADALAAQENSLWVFHQEREGLGISKLSLNSNLVPQTESIGFVNELRVLPTTWPRFDSVQQVQFEPWFTDNEMILPVLDEADLFKGFVIKRLSDSLSSPANFEFILSHDLDLYSPSQYRQVDDGLQLAIGADQVLQLPIVNGEWLKNNGVLAPIELLSFTEGQFEVQGSCLSGESCGLTQNSPIWSIDSSTLSTQAGAFQVKLESNSQEVWELVDDSAVVRNYGPYLQASTNQGSQIRFQGELVEPLRWGSDRSWNDLANQGITNAQFFQGALWTSGLSQDGRSKGALKIQGSNFIPPGEDSVTQFNEVFYYQDQGIVPQDKELTDVQVVEVGDRSVLVYSTLGFGLSLSADGINWTSALNQTSVRGGLGEVRLIPSVMTTRNEVIQIAYRLSKDSNVDIDIFNYNMEFVKNIQTRVWRSAHPVRSSDPREDVWDGTNDEGRPVSVGPYYVRVKDQRGQEAWSKLLKMTGPAR